VLLLPETDSEAAHRVAERICERLRDEHEEPPISVSTGTAIYPQDGGTIDKRSVRPIVLCMLKSTLPK